MGWRGGSAAIPQNPYVFQLDGVGSAAHGGSPEHPEQSGVGEGVVGSRGSPKSSHMVVEARLVSSCLSLPSRARPRFWRFAESRGVTEYVLEKVELAATFSLEGWERRGQSQPQPGGAQHHCRHLCRASPALPMQLLDHFLLSFPPLFPLYNHFFFLPPNFTLSLFLLSRAGLCLASKMQSEEMKKPESSCAPSPGTVPATTGLCCWEVVHSFSVLCFLCTCSSNPEIFAAWCRTVTSPLPITLLLLLISFPPSQKCHTTSSPCLLLYLLGAHSLRVFIQGIQDHVCNLIHWGQTRGSSVGDVAGAHSPHLWQ